LGSERGIPAIIRLARKAGGEKRKSKKGGRGTAKKF